MEQESNKAKIYKGLICLEADSRVGPKFWYQTPNVSFTPFPISALQGLGMGVLHGSGRKVVTAQLSDHRIVVNLARSDCLSLQVKGLWHSEFPALPFSVNKTVYTERPQGFEYDSALTLSKLGLLV
ncbi:MAG: hypothetical protein VX730_01315 [Pseudomonadota bacterium]|nr:hypothetical protein [Pseudomonadota bacterium]